MNLGELAIKVFHTPSNSFQLIARIDFENSTVDFFDDNDDLICGVPFRDCQLNQIFFMTVEGD